MATAISKFDRQGEDFYVEPAWIWDELFKIEHFPGAIYDPACGRGTVLDAASRAGKIAGGADIVSRIPDRHTGLRDFRQDFLARDNIVSNPPFKHADLFVQQALKLARCKVAMLLPATWAHGVAKGRPWLLGTPLYRVYALSPRPSMLPGDSEGKAGGGLNDFSVYVWLQGHHGPASFGWLRRSKVQA